jgi:spore coat polysaccharide biosynthesis predicted glycosyltransferase SpsG
VAVVPHQEDVAASFADLGAATYAGPLNDVSAGVAVDQARALLASAPARQALHDAGRSLVDAQGADRVATAVRDRLERA